MNVLDKKTLGVVLFNGVSYELTAFAMNENMIALDLADPAGVIVACEQITAAEFAADPTCATQIAALNARIAGALAPVTPPAPTPFLVAVDAFLSKLSLVVSGDVLSVVYTA